jgi:hypothetical protein
MPVIKMLTLSRAAIIVDGFVVFIGTPSACRNIIEGANHA